jgi:Ser/Thr protein kinase RdoA (MazF antagonist)
VNPAARKAPDPAGGESGPWGRRRLADHLTAAYGEHVSRVVEISRGVFGVARAGRTNWLARVFPASRPAQVVDGDARVLQFLEQHDYPAERCADQNPISMLDGHPTLVTEFVEGRTLHSDLGDHPFVTVRALGELVGRLHSLPSKQGAPSRPGGSYHRTSLAGGGRRADRETLLPLLEAAAAVAAPSQQSLFDKLRRDLENVDLCEDLPQALIHIDFGGPNVIRHKPTGDLIPIDWTGSGRGPRVFGLAALTYGRTDMRFVDAFMSGYREHVELEPEELARLERALDVHSLVLQCGSAIARPDRLERILVARAEERDAFGAIAGRVSEALAGPRLIATHWEAQPPPPPNNDDLQLLIDAVVGKTDEQVDEVANAIGGYRVLCDAVISGMGRRPRSDNYHAVFVLGEGMTYSLRVKDGKAAISRRPPKSAPMTVRLEPALFLRIVCREVSWEDALADGRLQLDGDATHMQGAFGSKEQ